jgi:hypothetical protein
LIPRTFLNLNAAEDECAQSRVYLGVQWEFDKPAGITQGNDVGNWIYDNIYQQLP